MHGHKAIREGSCDPSELSLFQVYEFDDGVVLFECGNNIFRLWPTGEWKMYEYAALSSQIARCRGYKVFHGSSAWAFLGGFFLWFPPQQI